MADWQPPQLYFDFIRVMLIAGAAIVAVQLLFWVIQIPLNGG